MIPGIRNTNRWLGVYLFSLCYGYKKH